MGASLQLRKAPRMPQKPMPRPQKNPGNRLGVERRKPAGPVSEKHAPPMYLCRVTSRDMIRRGREATSSYEDQISSTASPPSVAPAINYLTLSAQRLGVMRNPQDLPLERLAVVQVRHAASALGLIRDYERLRTLDLPEGTLEGDSALRFTRNDDTSYGGIVACLWELVQKLRLNSPAESSLWYSWFCPKPDPPVKLERDQFPQAVQGMCNLINSSKAVNPSDHRRDAIKDDPVFFDLLNTKDFKSWLLVGPLMLRVFKLTVDGVLEEDRAVNFLLNRFEDKASLTRCPSWYKHGWLLGSIMVQVVGDALVKCFVSRLVTNKEPTPLILIFSGLDSSKRSPELGRLLYCIRELQMCISQHRTCRLLVTHDRRSDWDGLLNGFLRVSDNEYKACLTSFKAERSRSLSSIDERHEETLEWFWESDQYKEWTQSDVSSSVLLLYGNPACVDGLDKSRNGVSCAKCLGMLLPEKDSGLSLKLLVVTQIIVQATMSLKSHFRERRTIVTMTLEDEDDQDIEAYTKSDTQEASIEDFKNFLRSIPSDIQKLYKKLFDCMIDKIVEMNDKRSREQRVRTVRGMLQSPCKPYILYRSTCFAIPT
ncbi:hypothetical protein QQZ08_011353 [Neonectria magnoliae]|uniref:Uncharacterized protein n=1 Tax=Neonectria magnoliae TaxID=2732573 RepID=A0ABR1HAT1_9HYPO